MNLVELDHALRKLRLSGMAAMGYVRVDTTVNVYTQVMDDSVRAAAETVGTELFKIVQSPESASELTH